VASATGCIGGPSGPAGPSVLPGIGRDRTAGLAGLACLLIVAASGSLAACAGVPDVDGVVARSAHQQPAGLIGAHGPLSRAQSNAILARLESQSPGSDILQRHLAIEDAVAESPLVAGNRVRILEDGGQTFRAMFEAIRSATTHINLEYYIIEDIQCDGQRLSDLLIAKRGQGVAVNLIYDSYGSSETPSAFFDRLKSAGANVLSFNPVDPIEARGDYSLNDRDHRKILIVDGRVAIVGGVNMSTTYQSNLPPGSSPGQNNIDYWRDTDLQIEGPVVKQLEQLFTATWSTQKGPPISEAGFYPFVPSRGHEVVRIIGSGPEESLPRYYATLLSAVRSAERTVWISTGYFVPTHAELEDLENAARRGVDVRLLLPGKSDSPLSLAVAHSHYTDLLEAGVRISEYRNLILHSKSVVIDGVWSVVGSSNFDHRSVLFNDEVDAVVLGRDTASQLEAAFRSDLAAASPIALAAWRHRPLPQRIEEAYARLWQVLL